MEERSKLISYIQLLAWLTRLCVFRLIVQCQVQSKDRLTMATQKPWARILTSVLGFERAIWISWWPRSNNWWSGYSAILKLSSLDKNCFFPKAYYFCCAFYSFGNKRLCLLNASYLLNAPTWTPWMKQTPRAFITCISFTVPAWDCYVAQKRNYVYKK